MRVAVLILCLVLSLGVAGCGGAAKPSVVKQTADSKTASTPSKRSTDVAKRGPERERVEVDVKEEAARDEPARGAMTGSTDTDDDAEEYASPPVADPAPRAMDAPTVAVEAGGGGFEGDTYETDDDPRDEVQELEEEIRDEIEDYTDDHGVESHTQRGDASCEDVCDLSRAICKSSGKICTISNANPSDGWIAGRCTWSRGECEKAQKRCTHCSP